MFDRFTDHARKAMGYARQEAQRKNHDLIGTEHMLVGVVQVIDAAAVLRSEDVVARVRAQVDELIPQGNTLATYGQLPFKPDARKALELAAEAGTRLGDNFIGTAHLLLGLIREDGTAVRVLDELGVNLARLSEALSADRRLAPSETRPPPDRAQLKAEIEELRRRQDALEERIDRLESGS